MDTSLAGLIHETTLTTIEPPKSLHPLPSEPPLGRKHFAKWKTDNTEKRPRRQLNVGCNKINSADECDLNVAQASSICSNYAPFRRFIPYPS